MLERFRKRSYRRSDSLKRRIAKVLRAILNLGQLNEMPDLY